MKTKPKQEQEQEQEQSLKRRLAMVSLKEIMGSSTHFLADDKLREKSNYHRWKMSIDLTLEDPRVLDHVRGNIVEPPSNASVAAWNK